MHPARERVPAAIAVALLVVAVIAPVVVAGVLLHRARVRAGHSGGTPSTSSAGPVAG